MTTQLLHGDCLDILKTLPAKSVQVCVTSPPYWGLRSYGSDPREIGKEDSPAAYVAALVAVFAEVWRVLRDDGTLWVNMGDGYNGHGPSSKNQDRVDGGKQRLHDQAPYSGAIRLKGLGNKQLLGMPWRVAFALQDAGWILRSDCIWAKPNCMPESVTDRPTRSHEYLFLFAKQARYYYDAAAIAEAVSENTHGGNEPNQHKRWSIGMASDKTTLGVAQGGTRNRRSVWTIATQPLSGVSIYGTYRIASPDCQAHDYHADLARVLEYDARRDASDALRSPDSGADRAQAQEGAVVSIPLSQSAFPFDGSFAIPHNMRMNKTADELAQDVIFFGIPADCTAYMRLIDRSAAKLGRTRESNTSVGVGGDVLDLDRSAGTSYRIFGIATFEPPIAECCCYYTGKVTKVQDHFAAMPEALIEPCILAGSAAQACETCGAAWGRVTEQTVIEKDKQTGKGWIEGIADQDNWESGTPTHSGLANQDYKRKTTLGFAPRCQCAVNTGAARGVVLDPFGGSGTVSKVAERYQRDAILIDLNADYIALQEQRTNGVQVELFV